VREVAAVNHYTIVMSERGAAAVATAVLDTIELSTSQRTATGNEATQRS
jgi:hypothetical protein